MSLAIVIWANNFPRNILYRFGLINLVQSLEKNPKTYLVLFNFFCITWYFWFSWASWKIWQKSNSFARTNSITRTIRQEERIPKTLPVLICSYMPSPTKWTPSKQTQGSEPIRKIINVLSWPWLWYDNVPISTVQGTIDQTPRPSNQVSPKIKALLYFQISMKVMLKQFSFKNVIILWLLGGKRRKDSWGDRGRLFPHSGIETSLSPLFRPFGYVATWENVCVFHNLGDVGSCSRSSQEFLLFRYVVHDVRSSIW